MFGELALLDGKQRSATATARAGRAAGIVSMTRGRITACDREGLTALARDLATE